MTSSATSSSVEGRELTSLVNLSQSIVRKVQKIDPQAGGALDKGEIPDRYVIFTSNEGTRYRVPYKAAIQSVLCKEMIEEDYEEGEEEEEACLSFCDVKDVILTKVIQFCEKVVDDPRPVIQKPLKSSNFRDCVLEWDYNFVDVPYKELFKLIIAANYMEVQPLIDLGCATLACMIKGKTPKEIGKIIGDKN